MRRYTDYQAMTDDELANELAGESAYENELRRRPDSLTLRIGNMIHTSRERSRLIRRVQEERAV